MVITDLKLPFYFSEKELFEKAIKKGGISKTSVNDFRILKKSLDARDKNDIRYVYTVAVNEEEKNLEYPYLSTDKKILIVGDGPSGLFCALTLARMGIKSIIVERGDKAETRKEKCEKYYSSGILDENSNVQFGEGGAGTFSDGKLNTGIKSEYIKQVLKDFVKYGADKETQYINKAHVGSDVLPKVVTSIRKEIEGFGGEFLFNTLFKELIIRKGSVLGIKTDKGDIYADAVILALGHSSTDTFYSLYNQGVQFENKPFAVGVRIEHLREDVNEWQYGKNYDKRLPTADYKLATNVDGKGVFTFCMCPGGYVMPSSSISDGVVSNGMSLHARNAINSNSAVIVQVDETDYGSELFSGITFQRQLEKKAYLLGGGESVAPVQKFKDFCNNEKSKSLGKVTPSYLRGYRFSNLNEIFSQKLNNCLKQGIIQMGKKIKGFDQDDCILTAVETRTSSPIKMPRNEIGLCVGFKNLYSIGEGAGYAGGITSSCVDGIKCAFNVYNAIKEKLF